jgi:hypothetical protein
MARRIEISIDLTKINKSKITEKEGKKYYNMVAIEKATDKYGNNWMVVEKQSKEERDNQIKAPILGNGKNFGWDESSTPSSSSSSQQAPPVGEDDLPF